MASDNFNRADAADLGSNWTAQQVNNSPHVVSNNAVGASSGYNSAFWSANSFAADHSAQVFNPDGSYAAPAVRMSGSHPTDYNGANAYTYLQDGSIQKVVNGTPTTIIGTWASYTTGTATVKITATGTTLSGLKNGSSSGADVTDSSLSSGAPGVLFFNAGTLDDWQGTDVGGGGPTADKVGSMLAMFQ